MNLTTHARRELELCGQTAEDPGYAASIVATVAAFASFGHSGGSASVAVEQIHELLQWRTLAPLTSDPDEWSDRSEMSGKPLWQNTRDPAAMSNDGGETWYFVDDRRQPEGFTTFVQWKGTELCMDLNCPECGASNHYDGFFAHAILCPHCGSVFVMPTDLGALLVKVDEAPNGWEPISPDDDEVCDQ